MDAGKSAIKKIKLTSQKRKRSLRKIQNSPSSVENKLNIHSEIEQKLRDSAIRNNLTSLNVKAILKKVVRNDHVLAIVKLKEEELERCDNNENNSEDNSIENCATKLTRLKAKELNRTPLPLKTLNTGDYDERVAAFITQDLGSDDDDEEYHPREDEIVSDDDISINLLDNGNKKEAVNISKPENKPNHSNSDLYSSDGLFKIPQTFSESKKNEENIALRTRSKLSLATTPIETIESTFIPPDITSDMYNFDYDIDAVWKEFLDEFTKPLNQNNEEDDDADPEYVAADKIPYDKEELRDFKVSKKELNILMTELLEMVNVEDEKSLNTEFVEKSKPIDPVKDTSIEIIKQPDKFNSPNIASLNRITNSNFIEKGIVQQLHMNSYIQNLNSSSINDLDIHIQIPEIGLHYKEKLVDAENNNLKNVTNNLKKLNKFLKKKIKDNSRNKYFASECTPNNNNFQETYGETFTKFQENIFAQQIRMHIQLTTQHFIQTYSHPEFWKYAHKFKLFLTEINDIVSKNQKSVLNVCNLNLAVNLCNQWQIQLDAVSPENIKFFAYLEDQCRMAHYKKQEKQKYIPNFHLNILDLIANSQIFMYPSLLPEIPFRPDLDASVVLLSEEHLISFGLEHFYKKIEFLLNKYKPRRKKIPTIASISENISKHICQIRSPERIYKTIITKKNLKEIANPIKYYFQHNKAPPFIHMIEPVDLENILAPIDQTENLSKTWIKYINRIKNDHNLLLHAKLNKIFKKEEKISFRSIFEEFHIYAEILKKNMDNTIKNTINSSNNIYSDSDSLKICSVKKPKIDVELQDSCSTSNNNTYKICDNVPIPRKLQKKVHDNFRAILNPENEDNITQKNSLFARNFYEKVEETLIADDNEKGFNEFKDLLTSFNPETDKVAELYYSIEKIFLPKYPEFAELFLTFLLPGHAAQIGKFFEHFILTNMNTFLSKLNIYFRKQPAQLKKIYSCINEISNGKEISIELIKSKIIPLLKGNRLLIDWFLQFFPSESPTKNLINEYDFETINMRTLPVQDTKDDTDVYEYLPPKEMILDVIDTPSCGLKYMQGHIYYGNRVLLPAKLSFLAVTGENESTNSIKTTDGTKDIECVHSIKEFGEQRLKEQSKQNVLNYLHDEEIKKSNDQEVSIANEQENSEEALKICDAAVLKAHSIRLNPVVHGANVTNHAEILCLLDKTCNDDQIIKTSPKRITCKGLKKKPLSPNKKFVSSKQQAQCFNKKEVNIDANTSIALQTSKKLKLLTKCEETKLLTSPRKKFKHNKKTQNTPNINKTLPSKHSDSDDALIWTRDEDKIILEIIKENLYTEDELLSHLYIKLKTKAPNVIRERYKFLLEILTKFQTND